MSILVTGVTGRLGRLVVDELLDRGVPGADIVATGRAVDTIDGLADRDVDVRRADFADADSLVRAFAGVETMLLVSTTTVGERADNHRRAIDAAQAAGVSRIVYTSCINADTAIMRLAQEHRETEQYLTSTGNGHTILRNGWYLENYTDQLPTVRKFGAVLGAAKDGKVSAASRADYAAAAAVALLDDSHGGRVYDLGGEEAFTLTELAAAFAEATGQEIAYADLPVDQFAGALRDAGLPGELAQMLADADAGLARGELYTSSTNLRDLIGRPTTRIADATAAALR